MKYSTQKLDGRYSYNDRFQYMIAFKGRMDLYQSPLEFNRALQWCIRTWGWTAEVRQYYEVIRWTQVSIVQTQPVRWVKTPDVELPPECNPCWTWSNSSDDLRIYLKSGAELAFFQLAHPVDQK